MKKFFLSVVVFLGLGVSPVLADVGVGVILGAPTGVSVLVGNRVALAAAWNLPSERVHFHGDVWMLRQKLVDPLDWYLGLGGKMQLKPAGDSLRVGVRVPLGVQWYALPRLELFGEIVPGMQLVPSTGFDLDAGVGVRFHF